MTRLGLWTMGVAVAALGVGCAGARSEQASHTAPPPEEPQAAAAPPGSAPDATPGGPMHHGAMMQCPMDVPGTQVSAADTPEGESVTFTTSSPDAVPDLRARIHAMADRYERRHARADAQEEAQGGTGDGDESAAGSAGSGSPDAEGTPAHESAPSRAVVEDIEGGARIDITPNDPADLDQLRTTIRDRVASREETGSCPMAHGRPAEE